MRFNAVEVFNGVFYNLDAQTNENYTYNHEGELYEFKETLGEGAFGKVSKCRFKPTGEIMAVKMLKEERMGG